MSDDPVGDDTPFLCFFFSTGRCCDESSLPFLLVLVFNDFDCFLGRSSCCCDESSLPFLLVLVFNDFDCFLGRSSCLVAAVFFSCS